MCFGLISAGLGIAQSVMGVVGQAKAANQHQGGGEAPAQGGEAAKAEGGGKAEGAEGAKGEGEGKKGLEQVLGRFREMLQGANSPEAIKKLLDDTKKALPPGMQEDGEKALKLEVLKHLKL